MATRQTSDSVTDDLAAGVAPGLAVRPDPPSVRVTVQAAVPPRSVHGGTSRERRTSGGRASSCGDGPRLACRRDVTVTVSLGILASLRNTCYAAVWLSGSSLGAWTRMSVMERRKQRMAFSAQSWA